MYENTKPKYSSYISLAIILDTTDKVQDMLDFMFNELFSKVAEITASDDETLILPIAYNEQIDIIHLDYNVFMEIFASWASSKFDDYDNTVEKRILLDFKIANKKTEYSAPTFLFVFILEVTYKVTKMNSFYMRKAGKFNFTFYYPTILEALADGAMIEISALGFSRNGLEKYIDSEMLTTIIIMLLKHNRVIAIGKKKIIEEWTKSKQKRKLYSY